MNRLILSLSILSLLLSYSLSGQDQATVFGVVTDLDTKEVVEFATVYIKGGTSSTETNQYGEYSIKVSANEKSILVISRLGYKETEYRLKNLPNGSKRNINIKLVPAESNLDIVIRDSKTTYRFGCFWWNRR